MECDYFRSETVTLQTELTQESENEMATTSSYRASHIAEETRYPTGPIPRYQHQDAFNSKNAPKCMQRDQPFAGTSDSCGNLLSIVSSPNKDMQLPALRGMVQEPSRELGRSQHNFQLELPGNEAEIADASDDAVRRSQQRELGQRNLGDRWLDIVLING